MAMRLRISKGFSGPDARNPSPPTPPWLQLLKTWNAKAFLKSEKIGNTYRYIPAIKEEEYKKRFMNGFVSDYFQNSYKDLVTFFANEKKISASDLKEIINLIENPKK